MKNKFSSLLLSLLLMGSLPALAETTDTNIDEEIVSPKMTAEELQEIKEICAAIADESSLEDEARSEYIQECIDAETMIIDEPEGEPTENDGMTDEASEGDDMADEETSESNES